MDWRHHTDTLANTDAPTRIPAEQDAASREGSREYIAIPMVAAQTELYRVAHKPIP